MDDEKFAENDRTVYVLPKDIRIGIIPQLCTTLTNMRNDLKK
jgi:hypothetical protein